MKRLADAASPEAPLWMISLTDSDLPSVSSQCCRSVITDYLAGLQDISLQCDSDQKVSRYHYCCINSSKTSPDWKRFLEFEASCSSQLTVQETMETFHKDSNTWDVRRRFQRGQICWPNLQLIKGRWRKNSGTLELSCSSASTQRSKASMTDLI